MVNGNHGTARMSFELWKNEKGSGETWLWRESRR
jgi:hypothetical protein